MGKSLDDLFDMADSVLGTAEKVLKPSDTAQSSDTQPPSRQTPPQQAPSQRQAIDAEYTEAWEEYWWAVALKGKLGEAWHAFAPGTLSKDPGTFNIDATSVCTAKFKSADLSGWQKLEHGKRIVVCSSCIIGVSRHG